MQEQLYKYLKKKGAKVERGSAGMVKYELEHPDFAKEIVPLVSDDMEIGIEIEIEGVGANSINLYEVWEPKEDGSLRNSGVEYVSCPIKGKRISFALNQFFGSINKGFHFSPRTSIHIHLNVLDLYPRQVGAIIMVHNVFEKLLYRFIGGDRDKNNFCVPICESNTGDHFLKTFLSEDYRPQSYEHIRYSGLNMDAIRKFGSLEFRHLGGTSDTFKIVKWINLIFRLKDYAMRNGWETIKDRIDRLNTDSSYMVFFNEVWGPCGVYLDSSNLQKDMEGSVSLVKKMVMDNVFTKEIYSEVVALKVTNCHWYQKLSVKKKSPSSVTFEAPPRPRPHRPERPRNFDVPFGLVGEILRPAEPAEGRLNIAPIQVHDEENP